MLCCCFLGIVSFSTRASAFFFNTGCCKLGFPGGLDSKESASNVGDPSLIPGSERSPGEGNGNPLQYSCLENPMDRGAWQATVHGVSRVGHDLATKPLSPWKESYDKPKQHIKKQRHYFADGPYSQSYCFSSSHV